MKPCAFFQIMPKRIGVDSMNQAKVLKAQSLQCNLGNLVFFPLLLNIHTQHIHVHRMLYVELVQDEAEAFFMKLLEHLK